MKTKLFTLKNTVLGLGLALGILFGMTACVGSKPTKNTQNLPANGKAIHLQKAFWQQDAVKINIKSSTDRVWQVLTDGSRFTTWNSTLKEFEGTVAEGEKVTLVAYVDTTRTFTIKVKEVEPLDHMTWVDGPSGIFHGVRLYTLTDKKDGTVDVMMTEVLAGYALAFAKKKLPDFGAAFETYLADLKRECENGE